MSDMRKQAVCLFHFLNDLVQLRTKTIYDVADYPSVYWFDELPHESGCYTRAWEEGRDIDEDVWLEIKKPAEPRCPPIPATVEGWVDPEAVADSREEPQLYERRLVPSAEAAENPSEAGAIEAPMFEELSQRPEVQRAWQRYVEQKWLPWSENHRRWQGVQSSYSALFGIHQSIQRLGEEYELAVGLGYMSWQPPDGREVKRHVLTISASIEFDANRGILTVRPGVDGAGLRIELDMLSPTYQPDVALLRELEQSLESDGHDPWDRTSVDKTIRSLVQSMVGGRGTYDGELSHHVGVSESPRATFAPAVTLRKRSGLTMRAALEKIIADIQSDKNAPIPKGIRGVCDINDDGRSKDVLDPTVSPKALDDDGVLFPLPTNAEQARIADSIANRNGVLVQGPPGTGKSHTIANLICHLLADGKRILVTAQTPRALKVLQDKLGELASLCVSVLGNDRAALESLEAAVMEMNRRHNEWSDDRNRNSKEIEELRSELRRHKEHLAELNAKLRDLREVETRTHEVAGGAYRGTAQKIAMRVTEETPQFEWLRDEIDAAAELPFGPSTFKALRDAYIGIDKNREAELQRLRPNESLLPGPEQLMSLFRQEHGARQRMEEHADLQEDERYHRLSGATKDMVVNVRDALQGLCAVVKTVEQRPLEWIPQAVNDILTGHDTPWKTLQQATVTSLDGLRERAGIADNTSIGGKGNYDRDAIQLLADAQDLRTHITSGKRLGWWIFRSKLVKRTVYLVESVKVDGRPCDNPATLSRLIQYLQTKQTVRRLWSLWQGKAKNKGGALSLQVADLEEQLEALNSVVGIEEYLERVKAACRNVAALGECAWHEASDVISLARCCEAVLAEKDYGECKQAIDDIEERLAQVALNADCHPAYREVCDAVRQRDLDAYASAVGVLKELERDGKVLRQREEWASQLGRLAPSLARGISEDVEDTVWDERLAQIGQAWSRARARSWLKAFFGEGDGARLERSIRELNTKIGETTARLCEKKAWWHFFQRLTEPQRKHLIAAVQAIRDYGAGKGKRAARLRREAQGHIAQCRQAIPAWVMPIYRIYETMRPEPEMFDVVVVDEASQCGPESLVLLYLAKKIVIVGDDKQISPQAVGVSDDDVLQLIRKWLAEFPLRDRFLPTSSLYDYGEYYKCTIKLREHFRCVPEIIRFNNRLCYRDQPLIPLRQYPPDRLRPIVVKHVPTGYREGEHARVVNRPEAEALVDAVIACCNDPRYEGLSMGVISLQAEAQAKYIESLLAERMDSKEVANRRLLCGDAYSFQGDERDVIFMSMVAAPNARIRTLTMRSDYQRFNVAASRARDQVWLFHTAKLAELSPKGVRHQLLNYYLHPEAPQPPLDGINVDELRILARDARRDDDEDKPRPFDSWFEVDIFLAITARGYRVIPQFRVGIYRIDLMVEGRHEGRLAVECDGDEFHGLERFDEDQYRQRTLERVNLRFWRIRGSEFYANQERALESLWIELEKLGIKPISSELEFNLLTGYVPEVPSAARAPVAADEQEEPVDEKMEEVEDAISRLAPKGPEEAVEGRAEKSKEQAPIVIEEEAEGAEAPVVIEAYEAVPQTDEKGAADAEYVKAPQQRDMFPESLATRDQAAVKPKDKPARPEQDGHLVESVEAEGAEVWYALSDWAQANEMFERWERSMLYGVGHRLTLSLPVTLKQAQQAMRLLDAAQEQGFR